LKDFIKFKGKINEKVHRRGLMREHLRSMKAVVILEYEGGRK